MIQNKKNNQNLLETLTLVLRLPGLRLQDILKALQQICARHRDDQINLMDDIKRLSLHHIRKICQIASQIQNKTKSSFLAFKLFGDGLDESALCWF